MYRSFISSLFLLMMSLQLAVAQLPHLSTQGEGPLLSAESQAPLFTSPVSAESWNVLAVDKSGLDVTRTGAALITRVERPEFTRELLRVEWRHGDPIDLYVILPKNIVRPKPVLYLYDYLDETNRFRDDGWCRRATAGGVAAVGFVPALTGDRFHAPRPLREWFVSELPEALGTSAHDVQMVLNYLATRADINAERAGMFGQGAGASIAMLAASVDQRIAVLDVLNPWGDWPIWLKESSVVPEDERTTYMAPTFLAQVAALDPVLSLSKLKGRNVRVEFLSDASSTPKEAREAMVAAAPDPSQVILYKDAGEHMRMWRQMGLNGWIVGRLKTL